KCTNIFRKLALNCWCSIFIFNNLVIQSLSHSYCLTRKVGIIMLIFSNCNTSWRVVISSEQRVNVIFFTMTT
uniref:Uncharacterized protein n=1 Tax=Ciona intestinalis TaxID=7719 RepID=H2Y0F3_CIOIN